MIIACPEEGWIMDAVRAEIVQRTVTRGEGFTERIAHIATKPVLRMRAKDGSSREWVLRDTDSPTTIINAFVECTRHRGVIVLPEGGTLEPDDDEM